MLFPLMDFHKTFQHEEKKHVEADREEISGEFAIVAVNCVLRSVEK